ncbi:DMT family transporter (plasmid) [Pseudomonas luteola]|uniref:DMT family transporter n=1 Tax=Pseudomonas luteola TaxID=47886 RepID=UPI003D9FC18E
MFFKDHTEMGYASTHRCSLIIAHIAAVLFGLTGIFGALIHAEADIITFGRAALALLSLVLVAQLQRRKLLHQLTLRKFLIMAITGALLAAHWISFFIAIKVGGVAVATLGFASFPAFIALLELVLFRERVGSGDALLLLLVTVGLVLVVPAYDSLDQSTVGLLWGLASGLSFALLTIVNGRHTRGMDALQVAFWQNAVVTVLLAPVALRHMEIQALAADDWVFLVLLGVFCTGLSQYLFVKSLEGLEAHSAGMIIALEPVYAIAFAWWLFGEQPTWRMGLGAALIVAATIVSTWNKSAANEAQ